METLTKQEYNYLKTIETLNVTVDKAKEVNIILDNKLKDAQVAIAEKTKEYGTLNDKFSEIGKENAELREDNQALSVKLNQFSKQLTELQQQNDRLIKTAAFASLYKKQVEEKDILINKLNVTKTEFEEDKARREKLIADFGVQNGRLHKQIEEQNNTIESITKTLKDKDKQLILVNDTINERDAKIEELEEQNEELESDFDILNDTDTKEITVLENKISTLEKKLNEYSPNVIVNELLEQNGGSIDKGILKAIKGVEFVDANTCQAGNLLLMRNNFSSTYSLKNKI
jgi:chromosome segregation ATPase